MGIGLPMPGWVADYSLARPGAATLQAAGASGVMRYIFPNRNDGACITADEIADFNAHGLPYGLVMEAEATWILRGYQQGHDLAVEAGVIEQQLGIPPGVTYAASDFDVQPGQFQQALATLHGMADGYGGWQYVGVYGSKSFCEWVGANSPITKFWSTDAWSNYTPANNAALHQHAQWPADVPVVPGCDHNLILGDWAPRTMEDDLTPVQDKKLSTLVDAVLQLAGNITTLEAKVTILEQNEGIRASLITKGDPTHYGLLQVKDDLAAVQKALGEMPGGGTVDPGPIVDGVVSGVKAQFAKAAS